jgi:hypothetical protein
VFNHIQAIQEINRLADIEYINFKDIDYRDWYSLRFKTKKMINKSKFVPNSILFFNNFIEVLLNQTDNNAYLMLEDNRQFLDFISFGNKTHSTTINDFFGNDELLNDIEITVEDIADRRDIIDLFD